jgi:hypothetical protein
MGWTSGARSVRRMSGTGPSRRSSAAPMPGAALCRPARGSLYFPWPVPTAAIFASTPPRSFTTMPPVDRNNPIGGVGTSSQLLAAITPTSTIITRLTNREQGFWAKDRRRPDRGPRRGARAAPAGATRVARARARLHDEVAARLRGIGGGPLREWDEAAVRHSYADLGDVRRAVVLCFRQGWSR